MANENCSSSRWHRLLIKLCRRCMEKTFVLGHIKIVGNLLPGSCEFANGLAVAAIISLCVRLSQTSQTG